MSNQAFLVLENGMIFEGKSFGAIGNIVGEVVFTTGMTGYLETLTDPSYYGQIILQTFPLIGNYGVIPHDFESNLRASAYIVKYPCQDPSNFRSKENLDFFLSKNNVIGLCDVDTRAITKIIRKFGVLNGIITNENPNEINLEILKKYRIENSVAKVSTKEIKHFPSEKSKYKVVLLDYGYKKNIARELLKHDCDVWILPHNSTSEDIKKINPDGIMLSNGPGDPSSNYELIENLKQIFDLSIPIFGICLGHQLLALANGFETEKLKYGHRGTNQAVKDLTNNQIYITSQNHGYAVSTKTIDKKIASNWFVNINDNTCEGIMYKNIKAFSAQFHPEACSGPLDANFLFEKFISFMEENKQCR